ncbi:hypothetical protein PCANB_001755 [Pneumocystis canis]|nr:hypothetical protein PCANB_001755 [Pneumocystis canis]
MTESLVFIKKLDELLMNSSEWDLKDAIYSFSTLKNLPNNQEKKLKIEKILLKKYIKEIDTTNELSNSVMSCDKALDSLESYLFQFQNNLKTMNNQIKSLKLRSVTFDQQLKIRKDIEKKISNIINNIILSPETIYCISKSKIDDKWLHNFSILNNMSERFKINKEKQNTWEIQEHVEKELEKLSLIAISRIREFLISKIKILHNPYCNSRAVQQSFLMYKCLFAFLFKKQNQLAFEIKQTYQNTMQWYYAYHFEKYRIFLEKLEINLFDTIILNSEKIFKKNSTIRHGKIKTFLSSYKFNINHRINMLWEKNQNIIMTHTYNSNKVYNLETIFYSYNQILINNIIFEYSFLSEFMLFNDSHELNNYFKIIFKNTLSNSEMFNKQLTESSYDVIGILLCIKIIEKLNSSVKEKKIDIINDYITNMSKLIWNQFQNSIDLHCENLQNVSTKDLLPKNCNVTAPDITTQKFGNLLNGIFILFFQNHNEIIETNVEKLIKNFIIYLTKITSKIKNQKEQELFLYNNYSLILTIISNTKGYLAEKQQTYFRNLQLNIKKS